MKVCINRPRRNLSFIFFTRISKFKVICLYYLHLIPFQSFSFLKLRLLNSTSLLYVSILCVLKRSHFLHSTKRHYLFINLILWKKTNHHLFVYSCESVLHSSSFYNWIPFRVCGLLLFVYWTFINNKKYVLLKWIESILNNIS